MEDGHHRDAAAQPRMRLTVSITAWRLSARAVAVDLSPVLADDACDCTNCRAGRLIFEDCDCDACVALAQLSLPTTTLTVDFVSDMGSR